MDTQKIEDIVKKITGEVVSTLDNATREPGIFGEQTKVEKVDDLQVTTTFDASGHVIGASAGQAGDEPSEQMKKAAYIDHTLLKPEATTEQIIQLCKEAKQYHFASVCVNATHVKLCAEVLRGSSVKTGCTIGFPLGATTPEVKAFETRQAIANGAGEVDMVINIGALKDRNYKLVARDIQAVVEAAHEGNIIMKVIIEAALLTDEEKQIACLLAKEIGADFVKTSTGFSIGGATTEDVALMRRTVGPKLGVKAAGGIRTTEDFEKMIKAGATRIGASAGVRIVEGGAAPSDGSKY